jgi:gamma-glutamylcysteine synthetase
MKPKLGDRVKVFNQVSRDWEGTVVGINKRSARVKCDTNLIFTSHPDARKPYNTGEFYLVPYSDLTALQIS